MADSEGLNAYLKTNNRIWYGRLSLHPDLLISINDQLNCLYKLVAPWNNIYVIFFFSKSLYRIFNFCKYVFTNTEISEIIILSLFRRVEFHGI